MSIAEVFANIFHQYGAFMLSTIKVLLWVGGFGGICAALFYGGGLLGRLGLAGVSLFLLLDFACAIFFITMVAQGNQPDPICGACFFSGCLGIVASFFGACNAIENYQLRIKEKKM